MTIKTNGNNWKQYSVYGESTLSVLWKYEYFMNVLEYKYWLLPVMIIEYIRVLQIVYSSTMSTSTGYIGPNPG